MPGLITDYGTLQEAAADWLYRTGDSNFAANAPLFIDQFEKAFKREVRVFEMEEVATITLDGTTGTIELPAGFLEMTRFQLTGLPSGPNRLLSFVTKARAAELDATTGEAGTPCAYTILAGNLVILPQKWITANTIAELAYYQFVQLKDATDGTNWLLDDHSDLYLYGALMQGAAYIDDKETVAFWKAGRDEAKAALLEADKKKRAGASPLRVSASVNFRAARAHR